jgi:acyl-CoA hydrolase
MQAKRAAESLTIMTELVLPNETNTLGNMMGGKLMYWMDICAGIAAQKHCNQQVVTASVDNISFAHPIKLGNILTIQAKVTRAFNTSMEIYLTVHGEDLQSSEKHLTNEAYLTFVALDKNTGKSTIVPEVIAETEDELNRFAGALRRRQLRLILAGKMKPDDASELKALFVEEN